MMARLSKNPNRWQKIASHGRLNGKLVVTFLIGNVAEADEVREEDDDTAEASAKVATHNTAQHSTTQHNTTS